MRKIIFVINKIKRQTKRGFVINKIKSFTLIETIVMIGIFGLAMGAVTTFIVSAYRTQSYTFQQATAVSEARRGIDIMIKEIRRADSGEDGSYPLEKAADKELIFYSDIDKDGEIERVRYFLGSTETGSQTKTCTSFMSGGSCSVAFSDFFNGTLNSAEVNISTEGDFGWVWEYADIYIEGEDKGSICSFHCSDCAGSWQGSRVFDVLEEVQDNDITFEIDSSSQVDPICDWEESNHSIRGKFELSWEGTNIAGDSEFKKGVIEPIGSPSQYPEAQEEVSTLSSFVRNSPPIFKYYNREGKEITNLPARLTDTKLIKLHLIVNVNPERAPHAFEIKSSAQVRNLKSDL